MLSAILITKNEEKNIGDCLDSINFADEIIVIDSGSTDRTVEIAKQYTENVYSMDWPGFGPQKQRALDRAKGPWILSIDADERITKDSQKEIIETIKNEQEKAFYMPRLSYLCGEAVKHSGWYPDYILRLFKKDTAQFTNDLVHEKVVTSAQTGYLNHPIIHYSYPNLYSLIEKFNHYTDLGAEKLFKKNKKASLRKAVFRAFFAFIKLYILKRGFLDGRAGFIIAVSSAETAYYKYLKLYFLHKNKNEKR